MSEAEVKKKVNYTWIKSEFVRKRPREEDEAERTEKVEGIETEPQNGTEATSEARNKKRRKQRGQNKNRERTKRPDDSKRFCNSLIAKLPTQPRPELGDCRFGDKCKWHHDKPTFISTKPEDIPEAKCPFFTKRGWCPYDITCRAGSADHISPETLENIHNEELWNNWSSGRNLLTSEEKNFVPLDFIQSLRKHQYDFTPSDTIVKALGAEKEVEITDVADSTTQEEEASNNQEQSLPSQGAIDLGKEPRQVSRLQWKGKKYLAPLTTVGNLPFRRVCTELGADITCGEMAVCSSLLGGALSEWSLVKKHESEKFFGVQICGAYVESMVRTAQVLAEKCEIDFIDLNLGCPIDLVCNKGGGCSLLARVSRTVNIVDSMNKVLAPMQIPVTIKMRTGLKQGRNITEKLIRGLQNSGTPVELYTLHGRSKEQRYSRLADWSYIDQCAKTAAPVPFFGCGDVLSYHDYYRHLEEQPNISGIMIARGALVKPWIFTEIDERRDWDISSSERLDILKKYVSYGLEHWGSDQEGVEKTRRFLLEWLSFLHRYIPVGMLERVPQKMNEPASAPFMGRDDLEDLMASNRSSDWIKISQLLLGPVPDNFQFVPKHKASAY